MFISASSLYSNILLKLILLLFAMASNELPFVATTALVLLMDTLVFSSKLTGAGITSFVGVVCRDGDTTGAGEGATTSFSCAGCVAVFEGSGVFVVTGFVTGAGVIKKSIPFFLFSNAITEYCAKS